ncbi:30S ribosomal protein S21, chloroplastic-like [Telopea speciosissima]|uniref:30S ribosomal protein S21, chloroplastic-like n=1 Tax=Telopea speciosissima TaxID=54955 RepID=UPI001CC491DB|nr:30S ribosomal protein S21, chloroplastic-like [Telopea speciosissima]
MAASSISNFLSFPVPSQRFPTKKTGIQLIFCSSSSSVTSGSLFSVSSSSFRSFQCKYRDGLVPVVANEPLYLSDLLSVLYPSLLYANTLFFKSAYNVQVNVGENESEEDLLYRFRKKVMKAGIIQECKRRRHFENKRNERKRKTKEAARRNRRRRQSSKTPPPEKQESSKNKKDVDEEEDNWEIPEGDLPY